MIVSSASFSCLLTGCFTGLMALMTALMTAFSGLISPRAVEHLKLMQLRMLAFREARLDVCFLSFFIR